MSHDMMMMAPRPPSLTRDDSDTLVLAPACHLSQLTLTLTGESVMTL